MSNDKVQLKKLKRAYDIVQLLRHLPCRWLRRFPWAGFRASTTNPTKCYKNHFWLKKHFKRTLRQWNIFQLLWISHLVHPLRAIYVMKEINVKRYYRTALIYCLNNGTIYPTIILKAVLKFQFHSD